MGTYTELIIGCSLNPPKEVIDTIFWMISDNDKLPVPTNLPNPESRIRWMLKSGGSYYFGAPSPVPAILVYDEISKAWRFHARFNIKNYENEIDSFLNWLKPFVTKGSGKRELWAIKIHEEDEEPTLYYLLDS